MFKINSRFDMSIEERLKRVLDNKSYQLILPEEHQLIHPVELGDKRRIRLTQYPVIYESSWESSHKILHDSNSQLTSQLDALNAIFLLLSDKQIYDGNGTNISKKRDDILRGFIYNNWEYFSTKFTKNKDKLIINHNYFINEEGRLIPRYSKPVEDNSLMESNIFVDLSSKSFNNQGMPIRESKFENYQKGKNIYYLKLIENRVARLGAGSDWADLGCGGDPAYSDDGLGARAKFLGE